MFQAYFFKLNTTMLNYMKTILSKVSFSKELFEKELKKAIALLVPEELLELKDWCIAKFGHLYCSVIERCFMGIT